jgi:DNA primase
VEFEGKNLPEGALPIAEWIEEELDPETEQQLALIIEYVHDRGFNPASENFYWTPLAGYSDRVILPFYYRGRLTGYTARKVTAGKPKYLSEQSPHFVFNADAQIPDQRYVFVCEGPFDALSIGGVALLTNSIHEQQARIIRSLAEHVIVIPDQDEAGMQLIDKAVDHDFAVAFPNWGAGIKDINDAVAKYGELFVLVDAIKTAQAGAIKIEMHKRKLRQQLIDHEH